MFDWLRICPHCNLPHLSPVLSYHGQYTICDYCGEEFLVNEEYKCGAD